MVCGGGGFNRKDPPGSCASIYRPYLEHAGITEAGSLGSSSNYLYVCWTLALSDYSSSDIPLADTFYPKLIFQNYANFHEKTAE